MNKLPLARNENIVVQELGNEVLIYDLQTHKAFNLNETSSIVYLACDGKTTFNELRKKRRFTDELIFLALDELREVKLIEEDKSYDSPFAGISRREAIRKVGLATMIALPVVSSLIAPTAAMAQSAGSCIPDFESGCTVSYTQSNCCEGSRCSSGNACIPCIPGPFTYTSVSNSGGSVAVQAACDASPEKQLCCDATSPADFRCDGFGSCDCECP